MHFSKEFSGLLTPNIKECRTARITLAANSVLSGDTFPIPKFCQPDPKSGRGRIWGSIDYLFSPIFVCSSYFLKFYYIVHNRSIHSVRFFCCCCLQWSWKIACFCYVLFCHCVLRNQNVFSPWRNIWFCGTCSNGNCQPKVKDSF